MSQKTIFGANYVISKDLPRIEALLSERTIQSEEITEPVIWLQEDQLYMSADGDVNHLRPAEDKAVSELFNLLGMKVSPEFVKQVLMMDKNNCLSMKKIVNSFLNQRKNVDQRKTFGRAVKDHFSPTLPEYRHVCSSDYVPIPDTQMVEMIHANFDSLNFHEATVNKNRTSLKFFTDKNISVDGRDIRLGFAFINSETGRARLEIGIFEADMVCTNQFTAQRQKYCMGVTHRIKDAFKLENTLKENFYQLDNKLTEYGKALVESNNVPLKIHKIDELVEVDAILPRKVREIPEKHKELIIKAFEKDNLPMTNFGLRSAITRVIRDNRDLEEHIILNQAIECLI